MFFVLLLLHPVPESSEEYELLPFLDVSQNVICAKPPSSSWGIVTKSSQGMKCITCSNANNNCVHIKFVLDSLESDSCPDFVSEFCEKCQGMYCISKSTVKVKIFL